MNQADCCTAATLVTVTRGEATIYFCGHHFTKSADNLSVAGYVVSEDLRNEPTVATPGAEEQGNDYLGWLEAVYFSGATVWSDGAPIREEEGT